MTSPKARPGAGAPLTRGPTGSGGDGSSRRVGAPMTEGNGARGPAGRGQCDGATPRRNRSRAALIGDDEAMSEAMSNEVGDTGDDPSGVVERIRRSRAGFSPTVADVEKYNVKVEIKEMAANIIPAALPDVTAAVINGNYAMDFGFKLEDAIFRDTSLNEKPYWNLVAARTADLEDPAKVELYDKVIKAFRSEATKAVLDKMFGGYVVSAGWDEDFLAPFRR